MNDMLKSGHLLYGRLMSRGKKLFAAACIFAAIMSGAGCDYVGVSPSEEIIEGVDRHLLAKEFNEAENVLETSRYYVSSEDEYILNYNRAIVKIIKGDCEDAIKMLNDYMSRMNHKHTGSDAQHSDRDHTSSEDVIHARIRLAQAVAKICPARNMSGAGLAEYQEALNSLYAAAAVGIDVRDQINAVLGLMIPQCSSFIPEGQKAASMPENAIPILRSGMHEFVLCNEGVWMKFDARAHEELEFFLHMEPLERQVRLDDSSKLPFSQVHVELYDERREDGSFGEPLMQYAQPLPEVPPPEGDYRSIQIASGKTVTRRGGVHYLHMYTQNNGEAHVRADFRRRGNCAHIDDAWTYTDDLKPRAVALKDGYSNPLLSLCPGRPDLFEFDLEPGQKAMISFTGSRMNEDVARTPILVSVRDEKNRELNVYRHEAPTPGSFEVMSFHVDREAPAQNDVYSDPRLYYVQNVTGEAHRYQVSVSLAPGASSFEYGLFFDRSRECGGDEKVKMLPVDLTQIRRERTVFVMPYWVCPGQSVIHKPKLESDDDILRVKIEHAFLSHLPLRREDTVLESLMYQAGEQQYYPVEKAEAGGVLWQPSQYSRPGVFVRPVTTSTALRLRVEEAVSGFLTFTVELQDEDGKNDEQESEKSKDRDEKEEKKDQRDKVNKQEAPNKSPDKPSESPTSARGAGDDAQGDESKPDENASGSKASMFDVNQYEKDHLDALLDDIERGGFYVPFQGERTDRETDKAW